jgi:glycosyltransferase involved in cell wall biosynthesis
MQKLRIAQVAPLYESVPPKLYGGTERVVSFITEELVRQGHDVTLFASGDSITRARLISVFKNSLRLDDDCVDSLAHHIVLLQTIQEHIKEFDVIHYHIDYLHYPLSRLNQTPNITTLHGRLNIHDLQNVYRVFSDMPVVSISKSQRSPLPHINWVGNVYHGLPKNYYEPYYGNGKYLAFLGRVSPEKGVDKAIEIAIRSGIPLRISAKVDKDDAEYFDTHIKHLLQHPLVEFIGEIGEDLKNEFLGNAMALLFPINWSEPFGLVMIEAMACGTPVVAFRNGSVPEIISHGVNGIITESVEEAVQAVNNISKIDRRNCRKIFEQRFTSQIMTSEYVKIYKQVIGENNEKLNVKVMGSSSTIQV